MRDTIFTRSHFPPVIAMALFFGSNLVVSRFGITQFDPTGLVSIRLAVAAVITLLISSARYRRLPRGKTIWIHGAVVGLTSTALPMMCYISALRFLSAGVTGLGIALTSISAMIFSHFRLHDDRITLRKSTGALLAVSGVGLLLATGETGLGQFRWEGFVLIGVGVVSNGFGIVHLRKYLAAERSLETSTVRLITAALFAFPIALFLDGYDLSAVEWSGVAVLVYSVVIGTVPGFILYTYVSARFGAVKASQQEYLVPVFATIGGAIFLGEQVSFVMVLGMVGVLAGIAIATTSRRGRIR